MAIKLCIDIWINFIKEKYTKPGFQKSNKHLEELKSTIRRKGLPKTGLTSEHRIPLAKLSAKIGTALARPKCFMFMTGSMAALIMN